jgi:3-phosphoshikimate 1-carboxyvinyltransferase
MVGANPLRFGLPRKLARLGARVERHRDWQFGSEPVSSITLRSPRRIPAFNVPPTLAQTMLDEFSLLALIATQAHGASHLRGAEALARRSPNQLLLTTQILREMGADVELESGRLSISGQRRLNGGQLFCAGERSIALLACSAALAAEGESMLLAPGDLAAVYPDFTLAVKAAGA